MTSGEGTNQNTGAASTEPNDGLAVGQVYTDTDPRRPNKYKRVEYLNHGYAVCRTFPGRKAVLIMRTRLGSYRYRLVTDAQTHRGLGAQSSTTLPPTIRVKQ